MWTYHPNTSYAHATCTHRRHGASSRENCWHRTVSTWRDGNQWTRSRNTPDGANEVRRLMQKPEIKEAVLLGAVPLELSRALADNAPHTKATVSHMQLTAIKRVDTQLQHRTKLYTQEAQQAADNQRTYYNLIIHYQLVQPAD